MSPKFIAIYTSGPQGHSPTHQFACPPFCHSLFTHAKLMLLMCSFSWICCCRI